jgi:hypothetical protein
VTLPSIVIVSSEPPSNAAERNETRDVVWSCPLGG